MFLRLTSATLLICVGCGGNDVHHLPDAPPGGDGPMADAPPDAPPHGVATVTLFSTASPGTPATGIATVFINPDGSVVANVLTDANGKASADVMPGASVTVVEPLAARTQMQTVLGIKPGDDITLGTQATVNVGTFTVNFPVIAGVGNSYQVIGPCNPLTSATSPVTFAIANNCKVDTMELVVIETNAAGQTVGFLDQPGVAFVDGGSTTIVAPGGNYTPLTTFNASYTNIPALVSQIALSRDVPDGFGVSNTTNLAVTGTTLGLSVPAAVTSNALIVDRFSEATRSQQFVERNIAGNLNADIVDVGGSLLPWLGQVTLDVTTGDVTVPVDPTGTTGDAPDLVLTEVSYSRPGALAPTNFGWLVFSATPGNLTLPALPASVGGVNPQAGDTAGTCIGVSIESDGFAGYDATRAIPYTILGQTVSGRTKRFSGARLRFSESPTPG